MQLDLGAAEFSLPCYLCSLATSFVFSSDDSLKGKTVTMILMAIKILYHLNNLPECWNTIYNIGHDLFVIYTLLLPNIRKGGYKEE